MNNEQDLPVGLINSEEATDTNLNEKPPVLAKKEIELIKNQLDAAKTDAAILEQKVAELVEAFEQKHTPVQCSLVTRWRSIDDRYIREKGGSVQVKLHRTNAENGIIAIIDEVWKMDGRHAVMSDYCGD